MDSFSICRHWFDKCRAPKRHKLLKKSQVLIEKELDLQKIIHRLRLLIFSSIGFLSKEQSVFIDKMSEVVLHESTADAPTSSDNELDEKTARKEVVVAAKRMMNSDDKADARFINVFRLMTARSQGRRKKIEEALDKSIENGRFRK